MKTIKKIKTLTTQGNLMAAITLAVQKTKADAPIKDRFYQQGKALKQLQSDYKNQFIEDTAYRRELNQIIDQFLKDVQELEKHPEWIKRNNILKKWWFWLLLFLLAWAAYRYFTYTPPVIPEAEVSLAFHNDQFILSPAAENAELATAVQKLNQLEAEKNQLQKLLGASSEAPLIHFREKESFLKNTIAQLQKTYQQKIENLHQQLPDQLSLIIDFDPNSAVVAAKYKNDLQQLAQALQQTDYSLHIYGYTDPSGSRRRNQQLSCDRAEAARDFLIKNNQGNANQWQEKIKVFCGEALYQMLAESKDKNKGRMVEMRLVE